MTKSPKDQKTERLEDRKTDKVRDRKTEREKDRITILQKQGRHRICLQIRYLQIERFLQCSLNFGERPTEVLHFDIKTDPDKLALPKITRIENRKKTLNLDTKWPKTG